MRVLIVEPGQIPRRADIPHTLRNMQQTVGGYIKIVTPPLDDPVVLICDKAGNPKGYELNHAIAGKDIIAGTFFLAGIEGEDLSDLPDELAEKYKALFRSPRVFARVPQGILALGEDSTQEVIG